jgi:hypothetical protein
MAQERLLKLQMTDRDCREYRDALSYVTRAVSRMRDREAG